MTVNRGPQSRSFPMTCNVGEAHLWGGYLLNLSSNCKGRREALPAPRLEQSRGELPGGCANLTRTSLSLARFCLGGNLPSHAFSPSCGDKGGLPLLFPACFAWVWVLEGRKALFCLP